MPMFECGGLGPTLAAVSANTATGISNAIAILNNTDMIGVNTADIAANTAATAGNTADIAANTAAIAGTNSVVSSSLVLIDNNTIAITAITPVTGVTTMTNVTPGSTGNLTCNFNIVGNYFSLSVGGYFVPSPTSPNTVSLTNGYLTIPVQLGYLNLKALGLVGGINYITSCTARIENYAPFTIVIYTDNYQPFPLTSSGNVMIYSTFGSYIA
jgi:hypothetical protein